MKLPNGEVLMVTDEDGLRHIYDPVKALKMTATKVRGQIATAKAKLRAL